MYKKKLAGIVLVVAAVAVLSGAGTAGAAPKKIAVSQIAVPRRGPGGPGFHPAPPCGSQFSDSVFGVMPVKR